MKRLLIFTISALLISPMPAQANKPISYQDQKAGQYCKKVQVGKFVRTTDSELLECKKDGSQSRWTTAVEIPFKSQKKGQFCKVAEIGNIVQITDKSLLRCKKDGTRARWRDA